MQPLDEFFVGELSLNRVYNTLSYTEDYFCFTEIEHKIEQNKITEEIKKNTWKVEKSAV